MPCEVICKVAIIRRRSVVGINTLASLVDL